MCSDLCPCPQAALDTFEANIKDREENPDKYVRQFSRTFKPTSSENSNKNRQGIGASILPFTAAKEGETGYTTFLDCYN